MKSLSTITLVLLLSLTMAQNQTKPDQVIEFFRHGARSPLHSLDPSWNVSLAGMLTPVGMREHYILGRIMAERYPDTVGAPYDANMVNLLTDAVPRCIQSALSHVYGAYLGTGPALNSSYPADLAVPPFQDPDVKNIAESLENSAALPYNYLPVVMDIIDIANGLIFQGDNDVYCPNADNWENTNQNDAVSQQILSVFNVTMTNANQYLNSTQQLQTLKDLKNFGDSVIADEYDNRNLPWNITDQTLVKNMTYAFTAAAFHIWGAQDVQKGAYAFNPVDTMLQYLDAFRSGQNYYTYAMLSGHDTNIFSILNAFGVTNLDCLLENFASDSAGEPIPNPLCYFPRFASNVVIEFYNDTQAPYVIFYYNNVPVPLCNGSTVCNYDDFVSFARNATNNLDINSYFDTCGANATYLESIGYPQNLINQPPESSSWTAKDYFIAVLITLSLILLGGLVSERFKYKKLVKENSHYRAYSTDSVPV